MELTQIYMIPILVWLTIYRGFQPSAVFTQPFCSEKIPENLDAKDVTTVATYSIMFYYTPEFAAITEDIPGFIDQVIAETNQGKDDEVRI